jgi:acetyl-CoA carboxylase carboxyl transferase subunit beta
MPMGWLTRQKTKPQADDSDRVQMPDEIWSKCIACGAILYNKELRRNFKVCVKCGHHFRLSAQERITYVTDRHSFVEMDAALRTTDPLGWRDEKGKYRDVINKLKAKEKTGGPVEAMVTGRCRIVNIPVMLGVFDNTFMMGSMGAVVGEKIVRLMEAAIEEKKPVVVFSSSGGARMQEGIFSLMQLSKVSAAIAKVGAARIPFISVLTDPTTGGVAASIAMQGDIIIAEPRALVGFAGPRVIEQTIKQKLPPGFQRAEFLLEHGMVDRIVSRMEMRDELARLLRNMGFSG